MELIDEDEVEFWRATVARLLAQGSTPQEAIEGAHLILEAYRRSRGAAKPPSPKAPRAESSEIRTGIRRKVQPSESAPKPSSTKKSGS